MEKNYTGEDN